MRFLEVIRPVSEAWPGSELPLSTYRDVQDSLPLYVQNDATSLMIISIAALAVIFFRQVSSAFTDSFALVFSDNRKDEILNDSNFKNKSFLITLLLIPSYAYLIYSSGVGTRSLAFTIILIASLLLFRFVTFRLMAWAGNDQGIIELKRHSDSVFILMMAVSLPVYLTSMAFPAAYHSVASYYLAAVAVTGILIYLPACLKTIKSSRFSHFFTFLYLCTLEMLPIAVVVKILVS